MEGTMLKIIALFIFVFCFQAQALDNWKAVGKSDTKTYLNKDAKQRCEQQEGRECFEISGKDLRRWKIGLVDDLSKPIFRAPKNSPILLDCEDFNDCLSKATNPDDDLLTDDNVCLVDNSQSKWDKLINHPNIINLTGPWFIWCEKETGSFQQKDDIVPDIQGSIDADAEDLKKKQDNDKRNDAGVTAETVLLQCFQNTKNLTVSPIQVKDCLNAIAMKILGLKIPIEQID